MRSRTVGCDADESYAYLVPVFVRVFLHLLLNVIVNYFPMQKVVELSNLLIYNVLLKLTFYFCPPFVHENFEVDILLHFNAECCIKWNGLDSVTKTEVFA